MNNTTVIFWKPELLIRAHYALIVIETNEPERAEELVAVLG